MSSSNQCLVCDRINLIKKNQNNCFVTELQTGYVVLGDSQFFTGYTIFICKKHVSELHELEPEFREQYLHEMSLVAAAVFQTFQPRKLNYELLGNTDAHLHWHLFPRHHDDPLPLQPIWNIPKSVRNAPEFNIFLHPNPEADINKERLKAKIAQLSSLTTSDNPNQSRHQPHDN